MKFLRIMPAVVLAGLVAACGGSKSSTSPTPTPTGPATLTKPGLDSPADGAQLDTLRPALTIVNGTSNQTGAKTYEYEISDSSAFSAGPNTVSSPAVAEDASGKTTYTVTQDVQPTTKYYWHARTVQGTSKSDWSDVRTFKSKLVGYNKPGALYDPLVNGETVGSIGGSGNITWVPGQGIRINDQRAYVVYTLPQVYSSGEISAEVTGLGPGGSPGKGQDLLNPRSPRGVGVLCTPLDQRAVPRRRRRAGQLHRVEGHPWRQRSLGRAKHDRALSIGVHPRPVEGVPLADVLDSQLGPRRRERGQHDRSRPSTTSRKTPTRTSRAIGTRRRCTRSSVPTTPTSRALTARGRG